MKLTTRASTQKLYSFAFHKHVLPAVIPVNPDDEQSETREFGDFHLDEIMRGHTKALVAALLSKECSRVVKVKVTTEDGKTVTQKKTVTFKLSRPSLRIYLSALTACLTNAQREDGLIPANPALALGKFTSTAKRRHESIDPLTPAEVPAFLQAVRQTAPDFLAMFTILIHCGLRSGECAALSWADVDFRNKYIVVRRTWTPAGRLEAPKNGKSRNVDLSDAAIATLKAHHVELKKRFLKAAKEDDAPKAMPEWVFPNAEGKPHNMTNVRNRIFYRALEAAGLHRRPLHATRHTFATLLLNQGESPVYVKDQCGHHSIAVTVDVYGKWIKTADRRAVNKLPSVDSAIVAEAASGD